MWGPHFRMPGWLLLAVALLGSPGAVTGNGWEHGTVSFKALVAALRSESAGMRTRAAESLGYRGEPRGTPALLDLLDRGETSHRVRSAAYTALGHLADPRALPALERCLRDEAREEIRGDCVAALGGLGNQESLDLVVEAFRTDSHALVRRRAVDALGGFARPESVKLLSGLLAGVNPSLRLRAIAALGRTGTHEATAPLLARLRDAEETAERAVALEALAPTARSVGLEPVARTPGARIGSGASGASRDRARGDSCPERIRIDAPDAPRPDAGRAVLRGSGFEGAWSAGGGRRVVEALPEVGGGPCRAVAGFARGRRARGSCRARPSRSKYCGRLPNWIPHAAWKPSSTAPARPTSPAFPRSLSELPRDSTSGGAWRCTASATAARGKRSGCSRERAGSDIRTPACGPSPYVRLGCWAHRSRPRHWCRCFAIRARRCGGPRRRRWAVSRTRAPSAR